MAKFFRCILPIVAIVICLTQPCATADSNPEYLTPEEKAWLKQHPVIRLGVGVAFPPFQWVETNGDTRRFKGMVGDYIQLLENRLGVEMEVEFGITFAEALKKGRSKEIDLFPCLSNTPERSEFLVFTEPYLEYPLAIIIRENSAPISDINDLNNKTVALVKSLMVYSTLENEFSHLNISYLETKNVGENLEAVSLGNADACIVNLAVASYLIHTKGLTNLKVSAPLKWEKMLLSMGIRNDWPEFHSIVSKTLAGITNKEKDAISQKWIQVDYPAGINPDRILRWGTGIGLSVLIVFGLIFAWNRQLQKEISERKRAQEAIRESENRYRALFESANDSIYILDGETYIDCNPKGAEMFGCTKDEIIGKSPFDFSPEQQAGFNSREIGEEILKRVFSGTPCSFEWIHHRKEGEEFYSDISLNRIIINDKPHILAIGRDISERKTMVKEKQELENKLRQSHKMEAIGTLSGGIAHDFNNILSIILGNTDLAMELLPDVSPVSYHLDEIRTAGIRAKDVVSQLLSFSRRSEQKKIPVDVNGIVEESTKLLRAMLPATVKINQSLTEPPATIMADPTQIQQVLINLCTNASHAMEDQGGVLEIKVSKVFHDVTLPETPYDVSSRAYVEILVRDTGHGIDQEIMDRIYDPYFTTKEVGKGSGMGLAVVHGIVSGHEGIISINSEPGEGSSVRVLFPEAEADEAPQAIQRTSIPGGDEVILYVDDEPSLVKMGGQILSKLGYNVFEETDPLRALEKFRSEQDKFDLVITDMTMPNMTGDQLIRLVREIRPDIPVIISTGYNEKMDKDYAETLGVQGYLEKPAGKDTLAAMVREVLDQYR